MQPVTIYTTSWCPYCAAAKTLLQEKGAAFTEIDVEAKAGARREMVEKAGGRTSVPQIFVGETMSAAAILYGPSTALRPPRPAPRRLTPSGVGHPARGRNLWRDGGLPA